MQCQHHRLLTYLPNPPTHLSSHSLAAYSSLATPSHIHPLPYTPFSSYVPHQSIPITSASLLPSSHPSSLLACPPSPPQSSSTSPSSSLSSSPHHSLHSHLPLHDLPSLPFTPPALSVVCLPLIAARRVSSAARTPPQARQPLPPPCSDRKSVV